MITVPTLMNLFKAETEGLTIACNLAPDFWKPTSNTQRPTIGKLNCTPKDIVEHNVRRQCARLTPRLTVACKHPDPARAEQLLTGLVEGFLARLRTSQRGNGAESVRFLQDQLTAERLRLAEANKREQEFRKLTGVISNDPRENHAYVRMQDLQRQRVDLDRKLTEAQALAEQVATALRLAEAERARDSAESSNRAKSEFVSRMSHELRTPLNAILGFTQLLEIEQHNARQAESIDHISRAGRNLLTLINEVLDIARIDSGRMSIKPEPVELMPLLLSVTTQLQSQAAARRITMHLIEGGAADAIVTTDRERFKQAVSQIVENAIHYNSDGGKVTISVTMSSADYWKVSVTDTGAGIPPELMSRLFVPFERLGQIEGGTSAGTGLGLALCQRLIKALDGRIGVSSTVGLGSTFWVEIPALISVNLAESAMAQETPALPPNPIAEPAPDSPCKTVLYVEDDVANYNLERSNWLWNTSPPSSCSISIFPTCRARMS